MEERKYFIDEEKLKAEKEADLKEREERNQRYWKQQNAEYERMQKPVSEAFDYMRTTEEVNLKERMENEIEAAKKEAEERVKEKYKAKHHQAEWNENKLDQAYKELSRALGGGNKND